MAQLRAGIRRTTQVICRSRVPCCTRKCMDGSALAATAISATQLVERLRRALAPATLPNIAWLRADAWYAPAEQESLVGGDWYDALELADGRVFLCIGDVTGHGLEAAITMSRVHHAILAWMEIENDPAIALRRVNTIMSVQQTIATAIAGFIDPDTQRFTYACAGHPPAVIGLPDGRASFSAYGGLPLGVNESADYVNQSLHLPTGAMLVLYTDGLLEYSRDIATAQSSLLKATSSAVRSEMNGCAKRMFHSVTRNAATPDDVAILAVRITSGVKARPLHDPSLLLREHVPQVFQRA